MGRDHDYELFKPRNEVNVDSGEFDIEFNHEKIRVAHTIEFVDLDLFESFEIPTYMGIPLTTPNELEDSIYDLLVDRFTDDYPDGQYEIDGYISVPYDVYYPSGKKPDEDNIEIDVLWSDASTGGLSINYLKR